MVLRGAQLCYTEHMHTHPPNYAEPQSARLLEVLLSWDKRAPIDERFYSLRYFQGILAEKSGDAPLAARELLQRAIALLRQDKAEYADVLLAYLLSDEKVELAANRLNMGQATFHRKRKDALPKLAEKLEQLERICLADHRQRMTQRLPVQTYLARLGEQTEIASLCQLLRARTAPWLVAITGIGGIGKTTLADVIARQMIDDANWAAIGWLTAPQSILNAGGALATDARPTLTDSALIDGLASQLLDETSPNGRRTSAESLALLESLLKRQPHLIVIDNLESEADLKALLPTLRRLANPSKFLITSRSSFFAAPDLYHWVAPQLDVPNALALLRLEAQVRNIPEVLAASDVELLPIYDTVGGNPLALKLVSGQLRIYSLPTILEDLHKARTSHIEELYAHIYSRAWNLLGGRAQSVLLAMPLVSEQGGTIELLQAMCQLPDIDLNKSLELLISLNLVEVRGGLQRRNYTIHSLTRTFLHEQVIRWQQVTEITT